jgi:hypothetical protein
MAGLALHEPGPNLEAPWKDSPTLESAENNCPYEQERRTHNDKMERSSKAHRLSSRFRQHRYA